MACQNSEAFVKHFLMLRPSIFILHRFIVFNLVQVLSYKHHEYIHRSKKISPQPKHTYQHNTELLKICTKVLYKSKPKIQSELYFTIAFKCYSLNLSFSGCRATGTICSKYVAQNIFRFSGHKYVC